VKRRVQLPPTMLELGWKPCGSLRRSRRGGSGINLWLHKSGAFVQFEGSCVLDTRRARLNGGEWEAVSERFHVTLDRALRSWKSKPVKRRGYSGKG
jgi:hypothetical protein